MEEQEEPELHLACRHGEVERVQELLQNDPETLLLEEGREERIPLSVACREAQVAVARSLLQHIPVPQLLSEDINGFTPLMVAIATGCVEMVNLLLEFFPMDQLRQTGKDFCNFTPLMMCCAIGGKGPVGVLHALLAHQPKEQVLSYSQCADGFTPLIIAVNAGAVEKVKALLQHFPEEQVMNPTGKNMKMIPLMFACRNGSLEIAQLLLRHNPMGQLAFKDLNDQTALHLACATTNPVIVMLLLMRNPEQAMVRNLQEELPLHIACRVGRLEICIYLLDHRTVEQLSARDGAGNTPAKIAFSHAHLDLSQLLDEMMKRLILTNPLTPYPNGEIGLFIAARMGYVDLMEGLLSIEPEAQVCHQDKADNTILHHAGSAQSDEPLRLIQELLGQSNMQQFSKVQNEAKELPLHWACIYGTVESVRILTEYEGEAQVMIQNADGDIPLISLCRRAAYPQVAEDGALQQSLVEKARILLRHLPTEQLFNESTSGDFALALASRGYIAGLVELLLEIEPDEQLLMEDGKAMTSLHWACRHGGHEIVRKLLAHSPEAQLFVEDEETGQRVGRPDEEGMTALSYACKHRSLETVRLLFDHGAADLLRQQDEETNIPIAYAFQNEHHMYPLLEFLIEYDPEQLKYAEGDEPIRVLFKEKTRDNEEFVNFIVGLFQRGLLTDRHLRYVAGEENREELLNHIKRLKNTKSARSTRVPSPEEPESPE